MGRDAASRVSPNYAATAPTNVWQLRDPHGSRFCLLICQEFLGFYRQRGRGKRSWGPTLKLIRVDQSRNGLPCRVYQGYMCACIPVDTVY